MLFILVLVLVLICVTDTVWTVRLQTIWTSVFEN